MTPSSVGGFSHNPRVPVLRSPLPYPRHSAACRGPAPASGPRRRGRDGKEKAASGWQPVTCGDGPGWTRTTDLTLISGGASKAGRRKPRKCGEINGYPLAIISTMAATVSGFSTHSAPRVRCPAAAACGLLSASSPQAPPPFQQGASATIRKPAERVRTGTSLVGTFLGHDGGRDRAMGGVSVDWSQ